MAPTRTRSKAAGGVSARACSPPNRRYRRPNAGASGGDMSRQLAVGRDQGGGTAFALQLPRSAGRRLSVPGVESRSRRASHARSRRTAGGRDHASLVSAGRISSVISRWRAETAAARPVGDVAALAVRAPTSSSRRPNCGCDWIELRSSSPRPCRGPAPAAPRSRAAAAATAASRWRGGRRRAGRAGGDQRNLRPAASRHCAANSWDSPHAPVGGCRSFPRSASAAGASA